MASPEVRDKAFDVLKASTEPLTAKQIADKLGQKFAAKSLYALAKRAVIRVEQLPHKRSDGKTFILPHFSLGPKADAMDKLRGRQLRKHKHYTNSVPKVSVATPQSEKAAQIGLVIRVNGKAEALTMADARALYEGLKKLFN